MEGEVERAEPAGRESADEPGGTVGDRPVGLINKDDEVDHLVFDGVRTVPPVGPIRQITGMA